MNILPQKENSQRAVRIRPAEYTPAVLRIEDGSCTQAKLELYSLTGGLLSLTKPLDRGSRARVLFLTQTGPVLGMAEMLRPLSWNEQPFRFLTMHEEDERKLRAATQPAAEIAIETSTAVLDEPVLGDAASEALLPEIVSSETAALEAVALETVAPETHLQEAPLLPSFDPEKLTPSLDSGDPWIQKYRTAIYDSPPPQSRFTGKLVGGLAAAGVGLGAIVYAVQHLLR